MDDVQIEKTEWTALIVNILIDLHAKQTAQTNLMVDYLAAISNKPPQELMDTIETRTKLVKADALKAIYSEYGHLPPEILDMISPKG